jgi:hypothetical protein
VATLDTVWLYGSPYAQLTGLAAPIQCKAGDTVVTVQTGKGGATVNVLSTWVPITLIGHGFYTDTVNVGNSTDGVQEIFQPVNVFNPANYTTLNVDDSADPVLRYVTITVNDPANPTLGIIAGLAPANITFGLLDVSAVKIVEGTGRDIIVIQPPMPTPIIIV